MSCLQKSWSVEQVVPDASVMVHSRPNRTVSVRTLLTTNRGRTFEWRTSGLAGRSGIATLRLPYATGANGEVTADPFRIADDIREKRLPLTSQQVERGETMGIDLR